MQSQVVDHLRQYLAHLQDEARWQAQLACTEKSLVATARRARQEWQEGRAETLDVDRL